MSIPFTKTPPTHSGDQTVYAIEEWLDLYDRFRLSHKKQYPEEMHAAHQWSVLPSLFRKDKELGLFVQSHCADVRAEHKAKGTLIEEPDMERFYAALRVYSEKYRQNAIHEFYALTMKKDEGPIPFLHRFRQNIDIVKSYITLSESQLVEMYARKLTQVDPTVTQQVQLHLQMTKNPLL